MSWWVIVLLQGLGCAEPALVRPGIDVLLTDSLHLIRGRRAGLLSNQTGIDRVGRRSADRLAEDASVNLVAIYSTEHGFQGTLDQADLPDERDEATGLPILNVYAPGGLPAAERFQNIDVLIIDLQDIGSRTYTYVSTLVQILRLAPGLGLHVIAVDRPNPIGGVAVQGPVRADSMEHFVAMLPVALRHGMTMGELGLLANAEIGATFSVIPVDGWHRAQWFDETGLRWVRPSPNMPDLESATHYPGLVLFEATNLSVGRGTPHAFQQLGAPWLDADSLVSIVRASMDAVEIDTTSFIPEAPTDRKYPDQRVRGVRLRVSDRSAYDPVETALAVLWAISATHQDSLRITPGRFDALVGTAAVREALEGGQGLPRLLEELQPAMERFARDRRRFLLYP